MKKIKFQLIGMFVNGELDLDNRCIILDLNIYKSIQKELIDYFYENYQFDIFGKIDSSEKKISAFECNVIDYRFFGKIKIHFLNLYIGDIHLEDSKNQEINKVMFQISYVNNLFYIDALDIQEKFSLTILKDKKTFQISVEKPISINEMNKVTQLSHIKPNSF
jgi:hypothetical protein